MSDAIETWEEEARKAGALATVPAPEADVMDAPHTAGTIDAIARAIENDARLGDAIGFNELESAPYVRGVLPWSAKCETRPWRNSDDSQLLAYLQTEYGVKNEKAVAHAFSIVCERTRFNPLIDRFDALPQWDGRSRAGHLLAWFLGAPDNGYSQAVERLLMNGAVMRTYHPGAKFDYMPVLVGGQGIGKSTFVRKLALDDRFFTDSVTGIGTREAAELVQGNLIVEVAELDALKGKNLETTKAFISRVSDDYRPPYGRRAEKHPRRFVMIGTTNSDRFLSDPSGNRRFLPVQCGAKEPELDLFGIDVEAVIEQAWAEVLAEYREVGSLPLVLPRDVAIAASKMQEEASLDDPRIGQIGEWLDRTMPGERVCASEIAEEALGIDRPQQKKHHTNDVHDIMKHHFHEWERLPTKAKIQGYGTQIAYQRTAESG